MSKDFFIALLEELHRECSAESKNVLDYVDRLFDRNPVVAVEVARYIEIKYEKWIRK